MNVKLWINGLRPKTLPASVAPVCVGAAAALLLRSRSAAACAGTCPVPADPAETARAARISAVSGGQLLTVFILLVFLALFMQIAANFANDYSDGIRGTDANRSADEEVSGKPRRLVASGVAPRKVFTAMMIAVVITALLGLAAVVITGHWWMLLAGLVCFAAGWFYTGGKHPYGYYGLGEVFVFIFFGLVATLGTEYFMVGALSTAGWLGASAAGLNAVGLLMFNNYRDIESDKRSGKHTYATIVGDKAARVSIYAVYLLSLALAIVEFAGAVWRFGSVELPAWLVVIPIAVCFGFVCAFFARRNQPKAFVLSGQGTLISALCWTLGLLLQLV